MPMERDVIAELTHALPVPRRRRSMIARELRTHVEATRRELELSGWNPEDAAREAVSRLGDAGEIAAAFEGVYRPSRRTQLGLAIALATGMLMGAYGVGGALASATAAHHHSSVVPVHAAHHAPKTHRTH